MKRWPNTPRKRKKLRRWIARHSYTPLSITLIVDGVEWNLSDVRVIAPPSPVEDLGIEMQEWTIHLEKL